MIQQTETVNYLYGPKYNGLMQNVIVSNPKKVWFYTVKIRQPLEFSRKSLHKRLDETFSKAYHSYNNTFSNMKKT